MAVKEQTLPLEIEALTDSDLVYQFLPSAGEYLTAGEIGAKLPEAFGRCSLHGWCACCARVRARVALEVLWAEQRILMGQERRCTVTNQEGALTWSRAV